MADDTLRESNCYSVGLVSGPELECGSLDMSIDSTFRDAQLFGNLSGRLATRRKS